VSVRRLVLPGLLAGALALTGCKRRERRIEPEPPPPTELTADPTPSGAPALAPGSPTARRPVGANTGARRVGDHLSVSWKGSCYPARILAVAGPGSYLITYEGYDHSWDETIGEGRVCGGGAAAPPAEGSSRRAGERVRVRWKGDCYAARITSVPRPGAYLITYEGYDHSWDETIGEGRICK
jgi:hypothetical protein